MATKVNVRVSWKGVEKGLNVRRILRNQEDLSWVAFCLELNFGDQIKVEDLPFQVGKTFEEGEQIKLVGEETDTRKAAAQPPAPRRKPGTITVLFEWETEIQYMEVKRILRGPEDIRELLSRLRAAFKADIMLQDLPSSFRELPVYLTKDGGYILERKVKRSPRIWTDEEDEDSEERRICEDSRALYEAEAGDLDLNDSDGYSKRTPIPREIMLVPTQILEDIWSQVEQKLRIPRAHFSLVSNSHYLEQKEEWTVPLERVEIRFRGRGAGPVGQVKVTNIQLDSTVSCVDTETGIEIEGNKLAEEIGLQLNARFPGAVLYRHVNGAKYAIPADEMIQGGSVYPYQMDDEDIFQERQNVILRGVRDELYGSGEPETL
jgi:hypothetical protein